MGIGELAVEPSETVASVASVALGIWSDVYGSVPMGPVRIVHTGT
jgi:hypothetical protein